MKRTLFLIILLVLLHCSTVKNESELTIIPQPSTVEIKSGSFQFDPNTKLLFKPKGNEELKSIACWFSELTGVQLGAQSDVKLNEAKKTIILSINKNDKKLGSEGYLLDIKTDQVKIEANEPAGIFYGLQTIRQIFRLVHLLQFLPDQF